MSLDPNDLLLFARVVELASFTRAAESLGIPKSTLSRRLSLLEARFGERLLLRTTRKLTITDFGRAVLVHAQQVSAEVEATVELSQHRQVRPSGRLRISMPVDLGNDVQGPLLADFLAAYPGLTLDIEVSPRWVDLIGENVDLAIRVGDLPDDASLAARRIATLTKGLYAAPAYLRRRGAPSEPEALMEHDALHFKSHNGDPPAWKLLKGEMRWEGTPPGLVRASSPGLLSRLALSGAGIVMLNDRDVEEQARSGELVRVLED